MADYVITGTVARAMLDTFVAQLDGGSAAVINVYSGTVPTDAEAALSGNTLLAQLTYSATSYPAATDLNPGARITANSITADSSADATGTATFFRELTQNAGTVIGQGTVGTSGADMNLNTTAITAGSTVSITAATKTLPEGAGRP